jgi:hypothetical protein
MPHLPPRALQYLKVPVPSKIRFSSPVRPEQLLRTGGSKRIGSHESLDARRWVEHGVENHQVESSR